MKNDTKISGTISASKIQKPANVITVAQSGGDFTSIQAAINSISPTADNRYLIKVMPGTYINEAVTMKSYINLQGAGRDVTILKSILDPYENNIVGITLTNVTDVTISGFSIEGYRAGILNNTSSPIIIWNSMKNNGVPVAGGGIINYQGSSPLIKENIISGNVGYGGIFNKWSSSPMIVGNVIEGNSTVGIHNLYSSSPIIRNNMIIGHSYDIFVEDPSCSGHVSFNIFDSYYAQYGSGTVGMYNVKQDGTPALIQ